MAGPGWTDVQKQERTSKSADRPDLDRWMDESERILEDAVAWLRHNGVDWSVSPDEL